LLLLYQPNTHMRVVSGLSWMLFFSNISNFSRIQTHQNSAICVHP